MRNEGGVRSVERAGGKGGEVSGEARDQERAGSENRGCVGEEGAGEGWGVRSVERAGEEWEVRCGSGEGGE